MAANQRHTNAAKSSDRKGAPARKRKGGSTRKLIVFGVELVVILGMAAALYLVMNTSKEGPKVTVLDPDKLEIPAEIQQAKEEDPENKMRKYMNIALFGVDAETDKQLYKGSRSDSMLIASINTETGDIKLVSVFRDTYLNTGRAESENKDKYTKCNAAYSYGGAERAVKMLNKNLDMDIENFVTVGYKGLSEVIDSLGGVYIDVDSVELQHINNYQITIATKVLKCDYIPVEKTGYQLLNGLQAAAYCRIRYGGGDDFKRTARQREVIKAIEEQAKKADFATLQKAFNNAIDDIYTSLKPEDILELLKNIANYRIVEEGGFPKEDLRTTGNIGAAGSCVVPTDLEANVVWLHQFLFDEQEYEVTSGVRECAEKIAADTEIYIK